MTGSSRLSCPGIVSGTTWCSIGQRREKGRVQQGGARHCRISVKIRRLLRKNTQTWVLSSVAKFVYCVQTVSVRCDGKNPIAVWSFEIDLVGSLAPLLCSAKRFQ